MRSGDVAPSALSGTAEEPGRAWLRTVGAVLLFPEPVEGRAGALGRDGRKARLAAILDAKLQRVPLAYVDSRPRGELLSRVTNDIDNVGQSMQQSAGQLLVSICTVLGVVVMMLTVSWQLTIVALLTIPLVMLVAGQIMKRSQGQYVAQWAHTGTLNGQIEEAFTAHELVKVFGRGPQVEAAFASTNASLTEVSRRAQFLSGLMMPIMMFVGNLQYVAICVIGGVRVASGQMTLGDVTAFIQYSRQFTQPVTQIASMINLLQSGVDLTVIALWLGHEDISTTHIYMEADLAMKEEALSRLQPVSPTGVRYRPPDKLMAFLQAL